MSSTTSTLYSRPTTALYGLTSLPANSSLTPPSATAPLPLPVPLSTLTPPTSPLTRRIHTYAQTHLDPSTFNHCLRVYSYGLAIARQCFPEWHVDSGSTLEETWFVCAMLHDIGTTEKNINGTRLSFEFWGGFEALRVLREGEGEGDEAASAPLEQAESVCEAIIRHQDVQDKGNLTLLTRLIHLGTLLDNIGAGGELVSPKTIEDVNHAYDRTGWGGCFRSVVEREKKEKPYAMVSRIEGFEGLVAGNRVSALGEEGN